MEIILESPKKNKNKNTGLDKLRTIEPLTENQEKFFDNYDNYDVISLTGYAGTGKTYIALAKALESLEAKDYDRILIIRSAVPGRDMGFLPGNKKEKMEAFEGPYITNVNKIYGRADAYSILKNKNVIQFESSSFLRGETFEDTVVIVDEAQNMSYQEIYTILTRIGDNCKVILCGDVLQDDLSSERFKEFSGYAQILTTLKLIEECYSLAFNEDDIVRSGFVKSLILVTSQQIRS